MSTLYTLVLRSELLLLLGASIPLCMGVGMRLLAGNLCRSLLDGRGAEPPPGV